MRISSIQRYPELTIHRFKCLRSHDTIWIDHVDHRRFLHLEEGGIEQRPTQHILIAHGLSNMIDPG